MPLKFGHKKGVENIEKIVDSAIEFNIKYLTLYAFSTENWQRPEDEVQYLLKLLDSYLDKDINRLIEKDIKIVISGDLSRLSEKSRKKIEDVQNKTLNNKKLVLNIAFSYGARQEIVEAIKKISLEVKENKINIKDVNEDLVKKNLYQPQIPDPDLLIRTAGDLRISNFLLYQIAYTELYFSQILWPDFSKDDFYHAIEEFNNRIRKYGKR